MKIDKSTLEKIAHLSRLYFDPANEEKMLNSINGMIEWVDKLQEVDTEGVEPLTHMGEVHNITRPDQVAHTISHESALHNAPKRDSDYFRVPKVIE